MAANASAPEMQQQALVLATGSALFCFPVQLWLGRREVA